MPQEQIKAHQIQSLVLFYYFYALYLVYYARIIPYIFKKNKLIRYEFQNIFLYV